MLQRGWAFLGSVLGNSIPIKMDFMVGSGSLAQRFIEEFKIPKAWVDGHFAGLTHRFYNTDRQGDLKNLNRVLAALDAWFYQGPERKPFYANHASFVEWVGQLSNIVNSDDKNLEKQKVDLTKAIKGVLQLEDDFKISKDSLIKKIHKNGHPEDFRKNLIQRMGRNYPRVLGKRPEHFYFQTPEAWEKMVDYLNQTLPENTMFSGDEKTLLAHYLTQFQDKRRAGYNAEITPRNENSNAVHAVSLYFHFLHFKSLLPEADQRALEPHQKDILLLFLFHDGVDEFINEAFSAGDSYAKKGGKPRPQGTELHRDIFLGYLKKLAGEKGISCPEALLSRADALLKALDVWKKINDETKNVGKALDVKKATIKKILKAAGLPEDLTKVPYEDLVLALVVKGMDRLSNNREHTAYQELSEILFPTAKLPPVLQVALLEALRPHVDEKSRHYLESSIQAIGALQKARPDPDYRNPKALILAFPENSPLLTDYVTQALSAGPYNIWLSDWENAAKEAFTGLFGKMADLDTIIGDRKEEVRETLEDLPRSLPTRMKQFLNALNVAGICGQVGFGLTTVLQASGAIHLPDMAQHIAASGQWWATIPTMIPMLRYAFEQRSLLGAAAVGANVVCLGQMAAHPEQIGVWLIGMLVANSLWSLSRNKHTVAPNDRLQPADVRNLRPAIRDEIVSKKEFLLESLSGIRRNGRTVFQHAVDTAEGRKPDADWSRKLENLQAFHSVSAVAHLVAILGYFSNNPVLRGVAEPVLGGLVVMDGTRERNPAWQVSGLIQIGAKFWLAGDPNNPVAAGTLILSYGLFGVGLMELGKKQSSDRG
jgi:hypothetical protein